MEKGDLEAGTPTVYVMVVWEHLVAVAGPHFTPGKFSRRLRIGLTRTALNLLVVNDHARSALWQMWNDHRPVCLITYLPRLVLPALRERLADDGIPHARLLQIEPHVMAATIGYRQDAACVFDTDPAHAPLYGSKGRIIRPDQAPLMSRYL